MKNHTIATEQMGPTTAALPTVTLDFFRCSKGDIFEVLAESTNHADGAATDGGSARSNIWARVHRHAKGRSSTRTARW